MSKAKGFTLIELLVVIAIIGILASIVLVSFPSATKKAKDSRIISAIAQARTVMTYMNANDGDYEHIADVCTNASNPYYDEMKSLCDEVANNGGSLNLVRYDGDSDGKYEAACMYSVLNTGEYYCADSTGVAGTTPDDPGDATNGTCGGGANTGTCPASTKG